MESIARWAGVLVVHAVVFATIPACEKRRGGGGEDCCRYCEQGVACGDACIERLLECHEPTGCACDGSPPAGDGDADADADADPDGVQLTVEWRFEDRLGCAAQEGSPTEVVVLLYLDDYQNSMDTVGCETGRLALRELPDSDNYDLQVTALSEAGVPLFRAAQLDIALTSTEGDRTVTQTLISCADIGGCELP